MIVLHQFGRAWGLPNISPFCFKVENYLLLAGLPYEVKVTDPRKGPKKKLPFIDDEGTVVCDSDAIVAHLEQKHGAPLDGKLSDEERAQSRIVRRAVEEGYYFCLLYSRWVDDAGFALAERDLLRPMMPPVVRSFVPGIIRKTIIGALAGQGTGRHSASEVYAMGNADLSALSTLLGDRPYFQGEAPTSLDATLYAFLAITLWAPPGSPLTAHVKTLANLVGYCERMKERLGGSKSAN